MREERKLKKALQRDGIETQSDILDELKRRYPQYASKSTDCAATKKKRMAFVYLLAAAVACVAIIVPCALLLPNKDINNGDSHFSVYSDSDYNKVEVDYTLREYSETSGGKILYFDWYDIAEEFTTYNYKSKADETILGVEEFMYLGETDEMIYLSVTPKNVYLSAFESNIDSCNKEHIIHAHTVRWNVSGQKVLGIFEDGDYRYFIRIEEGHDENRLFKLAGELLGKD